MQQFLKSSSIYLKYHVVFRTVFLKTNSPQNASVSVHSDDGLSSEELCKWLSRLILDGVSDESVLLSQLESDTDSDSLETETSSDSLEDADSGSGGKLSRFQYFGQFLGLAN